MNNVVLIGRLTRDCEVRYSNDKAVGRYTLAVDRRYSRDGEVSADFINCVVFGKAAEWAEKYTRKGMKLAVSGRIQTGSYTNKDGQRVFTTDVIVESQEFVEKKTEEKAQPAAVNEDEFMSIPDGIEELPFM